MSVSEFDSTALLASDVFRAFAAMAKNAMTESAEDERLNVEAKDYYRALTHETRKMIFADISASMAMTARNPHMQRSFVERWLDEANSKINEPRSVN